MQTNIDTLNVQLTAAQTKYDTVTAALNSQIATLTTERDEARTNVTNLQGQVATLQAQANSQQETINNLTETNSQLQGQITLKDDEILALQGAVATRDASIAALNATITALEASLALKIGASGTLPGNVTQYTNNYTTNLNNDSVVQEIRDRVQLSATSVLQGWTYVGGIVNRSYFSNEANVALALSMDFATEISEEFGALMGQIFIMDETTFYAQLHTLYDALPTTPVNTKGIASLMLEALKCLPNLSESDVIIDVASGTPTSIAKVNKVRNLLDHI